MSETYISKHGLAELAVVEVVAELLCAAAVIFPPLALGAPLPPASPLPGDAVRVLAVVVVATARAGVGAALHSRVRDVLQPVQLPHLLPDHVQPLPPLLVLLVTRVVGSSLLRITMPSMLNKYHIVLYPGRPAPSWQPGAENCWV